MLLGWYKKISALLLVTALTFFLQAVFSGRIILPQTFSIGFFVIHYYGIIMALAIATAFYFALNRAPSFGIEKAQAEDLIFWLIIGGFVGARLYHVVSSWEYYLQNPVDVIKVWQGGLSIYGAVLGGLMTMWLYKRLVTFNLSLLTIFDWLVPSLLLGQIIGRFGNLFNYEAYGLPSNLPWKMFVPQNFRGEHFVQYSYFHPWFLYEAIGNALILIFLLAVTKSKYRKVFVGEVAFLYLLLYNILRFGLEFLRIDSTFIFNFRQNALVSLLIVIVVSLLLYKNGKSYKIS
jgi:phosphatidylglycerol:prolipoprotein diacylglycerol transferase